MTKIYKSKIGLALVIFIFGIFFLTFILIFLSSSSLTETLILLPAACFVVHVFLTTYYTIEKSTLKIKSGFIYNLEIDIHTIKKITASKSILSSPATSFERLEISYNKYDSVLISPKFKDEFIQHLKSINSSIETD